MRRPLRLVSRMRSGWRLIGQVTSWPGRWGQERRARECPYAPLMREQRNPDKFCSEILPDGENAPRATAFGQPVQRYALTLITGHIFQPPFLG